MKLDLLEDLVYLGVCLKLVMKTLDSGETILAEHNWIRGADILGR
jgi:hypothetical protein